MVNAEVNCSKKLDKTGVAPGVRDVWWCGHMYRILAYGKRRCRCFLIQVSLSWFPDLLATALLWCVGPVVGAGQDDRQTLAHRAFLLNLSCFSARSTWKQLIPPTSQPSIPPAGLLGQTLGLESSRFCTSWGKRKSSTKACDKAW